MEQHFETLYCVDKKGKTKEWNIMVVNNGNHSVILCNYGYINGKKTECKIVVNSGKNIGKKNETTHFEQAVMDAKSKWKKKIDIDKYTTNLPNVFIDKVENNDNFIILPMLAHDFSKHEHKLLYPSYIQPKLDGYRMIYNKDSKKVTTRTGKEFSILYDTDLYKELLHCNVSLDGELYVHDPTFKFENYGVLRKQKKLTPAETNLLNRIEYHVYDIPDSILPFSERFIQLSKMFSKEHFNKIKFVETKVCVNKIDAIKYNEEFLQQNYEGSMLRNRDGKYKQKFRSYDLLKLKTFHDHEFEIVNFTNEKDTSGVGEDLVVWICKTQNGDLFNVRPQGTQEERRNLFKQAKNYIGKYLWVKYFELTDKGVPRFPSTKTDSFRSYIRNECL